MANANTIDINGVGPVLFERSKRAKRVSISVKPFKGVRVAVPHGLSFKEAAQFAQTKVDWIRIHLEKIRQYEREYNLRRDIVEDIDRVKAKTLLTRRLQQLARNNGFSYSRVFIRNKRQDGAAAQVGTTSA